MTYIEPLNDPTPIKPRAEIDTTDLPDYATTADEWWLITDRIWPAILDIAQRVGADADDMQRLESLKGERKPELSALFNDLWIKAPDAGFIHTWPQWSRFCDLCSESHVLFPEDDEG